MTDFEATFRHFCRNPRCRSKLPSPVANEREAFCCRGCHTSFYLHRCIVCEGPIERNAGNKKVCRKATCRKALKGRFSLGRYHTPQTAKLTQKVPDFIGSKLPLKPDRPTRIGGTRGGQWREVVSPDGVTCCVRAA